MRGAGMAARTVPYTSHKGDCMTYAKRPHDHASRLPAADDHRELDELRGRPGSGALADIMLQLDRGSPAAADGESVHAAAEHGTRGAATSLPHLDTIQQAFGRHDVGGIEAHVGGAATEGALAMGARAYATGNHVAFADTPSLHTAAHEAAHVVQQRGGVQLEGGVGASGDAYEQHADRVADAVVAGQSAQGLLDEMKPGAGATSSVQRTVQMDRFIGEPDKHHLHVDIGQAHYKFGKDRGSRKDFGGNGTYRLNDLIEARNYLVDNGFTEDGAQACIDWLESECRDHPSWDEAVGFKTTYEEVEEANPHVDHIVEKAEGRGVSRDDLSEAFNEVRDGLLEAETALLTDEDVYPDGTEASDLEDELDGVSLDEVLAGWSGLSWDTDYDYNPKHLLSTFKDHVKAFLRDRLEESLRTSTGKRDESEMRKGHKKG